MVDQEKEAQHSLSRGAVLSGGPGIVVLSPSLEVLHMNRQALKLAGMLGTAEPRGQELNHSTSVLTPPLTNLAGEVLNALRRANETTDKGQFEIRHVAGNLGKRVQMRGIGVPSVNGLRDSRIVLVLAEMGAGSEEAHRASSLPS